MTKPRENQKNKTFWRSFGFRSEDCFFWFSLSFFFWFRFLEPNETSRKPKKQKNKTFWRSFGFRSIECCAWFVHLRFGSPITLNSLDFLVQMFIGPHHRNSILAVVASHIVRTLWFGSETEIRELRSELTNFRGELVRSESAILASRQALEACVLGAEFQNFVLKWLLWTLFQVLLIGIVWWGLRVLQGWTVKNVQPVSGEDSETEEEQSGSEVSALVKGTPILTSGRVGPVRPSDLRRLVNSYGQQ